jgi:hypothetical protein
VAVMFGGLCYITVLSESCAQSFQQAEVCRCSSVRQTSVCRLIYKLFNVIGRQTKGTSDQLSRIGRHRLSTRSVSMNLARPFKAGNGQGSVRVA